jgi:hypothetical protein
MNQYVYAHINPVTAEVVYIGKGRHERAWSLSRRDPLHAKFLRNLSNMGYSPTDYGIVVAGGLTDDEASALELRLIKQLKPLFNQQGVSAANAGRGEKNKQAVLSDDLVRKMRAETGLSLRAIGRKYGVTYSTVRKAVTGISWAHIT